MSLSVGDGKWTLTFGRKPKLSCSCGWSAEVPCGRRYIKGTDLAKLRHEHHCDEEGTRS